ncbi:type III pantothenate kinase [uncultured Bifidobacterium sp.]|uniref:type III pantothenate kinase n=1 Tax=uncultured Bifidobacterium sp. TaxID=165187 RepID=UPI00261D14B3|nr:type III pantothenate kinase [uncultured Bifidobacterium sp.]
MLLAVDIGNTNIVLGLLDGPDIVATHRISTGTPRTADEYGLLLTELLARHNLGAADIDDVIVSSVVPKVMHSFRASIVTYLDVDPMIVGPGVRSGIRIAIDDPKSLGADCLADCAGAYYLYGGPVLVADFGTATTFNYVDASGTIVSGLITTGIRTGANALWSSTAQLPEVEITRPKTVMTRNTREAMQAGLYYGFLGGVERTIQQFHEEIAENFRVVATGGLGRIFANDTDAIDVYDPELIFKGMAVIYAKTRKSRG